MVSEIRKATEADLEKVKTDPLHEWNKSYPIDRISDWAKSLYIYDELVAVGGVVQFWNGVGEVWMVLGSKAAEHKIEVVRQARRVIEMAFIELKLWRVQAVERVDFEDAIRFTKHLGFKTEGVLRKYTPDKSDVYMTSIVKGE